MADGSKGCCGRPPSGKIEERVQSGIIIWSWRSKLREGDTEIIPDELFVY